MEFLKIIDWILFILCALPVVYVCLFAIASKFSHRRYYPLPTQRVRFAVLFPAYKEDKVIIPAVTSFLEQDYPSELYQVIVISDQMTEDTNRKLRQLPVRVLIADYTESSKAKALSLAMDSIEGESYDMIVIMDGDNHALPNLLKELNRSYHAGNKAIQAHRTSKNLNTPVAILDAVSEEINNSIFRSGHITLGLSSALIGSGMAIDANWFRRHVNLLKTAGEDKEIEALLLKEGIFIDYLEGVYVYDEKTQKKEVIKNQRKRWLAAQFDSLAHTLPDLPKALWKGNFDYCDKIIQWMLPPRVLLLALLCFLSALVTIICLFCSVKWWILTGVLFLSLLIAIPGKLMNRKLLSAIVEIPSIIWIMISNMLKLKGVNKKFIHTEHDS